jgi:P-type E1-E2 ATPase
VAVATGLRSELGKISSLIGTVQTLRTPLVRQMDHFAQQVTLAVLAASVAVFAFAVAMRGYAWAEAFMVVVGIAVAAIPEGLPAVMTITLAVGVQRMARRNAIIRHLPAVETLGAVSVICSDKTGTLTGNEMTVRAVVTTDGSTGVSGAGYRPVGEFSRDGHDVDPTADALI